MIAGVRTDECTISKTSHVEWMKKGGGIASGLLLLFNLFAPSSTKAKPGRVPGSRVDPGQAEAIVEVSWR